MLADEAKTLLGFSPNCRPSPSQVKAAYRRKVWETHPDRFPAHEKSNAECKFKMICEAYSFLCSGARVQSSHADSYSYVVRTGVPRTYGGRRNQRLVGFPFLFIIVGTVALAGSNVARAYRKEKQAYPSHNPFLP
nr:chaperone protein DnaJ isoform X2 [Ipomoea batatas]